MYFELVFFVVLVSLVLQGWTIAPVAKWLGIDIPPRAREPDFVYLPLHDSQHKDLYVYPIVPNSAIQGGRIADIPSAEGSQVVGLIRNGVLVDSPHSVSLNAGDLVLILGGTGTQSLLASVFSVSDFRTGQTGNFYGQFSIKPYTLVGDIANAYGFNVDPSISALRVDEYINQCFHGRCVAGDAAPLGPMSVVVRAVGPDSAITEIGLKLVGGNH